MNQRGSISWRYAAGIAAVGASLIVVIAASSYSAGKPTAPATPVVRPYTAAGNATLVPNSCPSPAAGGSTCFSYTGSLRGIAPGPIMASISGDLSVGASSGGTTPDGGVCSLVNGNMTLTGKNGKFRNLTIDFVGTQCDSGAAPPLGTTGPTILNGSFATTGGNGTSGSGAGTITISNDGSNNLLIVLGGALQMSGANGGPSPTSSGSPKASPSHKPSPSPKASPSSSATP